MPETPEELYERVKDSLRMPPVEEWDSFPFDGEMAPRVDALYFFLVGLTVFFSLLIAGLIVFYAIKYRRREPNGVGEVFHGGMLLEITWTVIPFVIAMIIFVWGADRKSVV